MENNVVVFDNAVTVSHTVYKKGFGCKLNELSIRDYKKKGFNDKIVCLDLDSYEKSFRPQSLNNTMDAAVGISDYHNTRRVNKRLILVELRLDYKNANNLSGTELKRKSTHSRELLGEEISINPVEYFVFRDSVVQQALRIIDNLAVEQGYKGKWYSLTVEDFNALIQDSEDIPYVPLNSPTLINQEFIEYNHDFNRLINTEDKWLNKSREYVNRFNLDEAKVICNCSIEALNTILSKDSFDEEELWYIEEFITDFKGVLNSIPQIQ